VSENFERLGNYILLEKINAGGMAEVYLSKSIGANGINKFLAIKRILPQFADNREFIEMFKEEAKIAVNLNHNNVVSIIDFKASQNQLYLVMEHVQGQNLRQILQQKKKKGLSLSLDFIVYVIREVSAGLDHAHRCVDKGTGKPLNIIHRDMSPQNIMISYDGEVKIVDFGIAKAEAAGESTRVGTLKGKFSYMSPEQAEGLIIDQGSDIFSLGIILWELIADDRLFVANNEMNILKRIKECDVPELRRVNPTVPAELERIVKKTLMKDKSLRYQSSADLQKDLTRFLNREYPEFTPSDFSTFMKFLFESEYSMAQERMVNYAKLDFGSLNELSEATQFTNPAVHSSPVPPQPSPQEPRTFTFDSELDLNRQSKSGKQNKAAPDFPDSPNGSQNILNAPTQLGAPPKTRPGGLDGFGQNTGLRKQIPTAGVQKKSTTTNATPLGPRTSGTNAGIRYRTPTKPPVSEFAKAALSLSILAALFFGIYTFAPKPLRREISTRVSNLVNHFFDKYVSSSPPRPIGSTPPELPVEGGGGGAFASRSVYKILVKSNPGRARIYVNSIDQGVTTPATIEVEANTPFTLTLLADGYLQYTTKMNAIKDGQDVSANLTQVKFGYININVINAGVDTIIYIDNLELKDRPPITKYPVQSDKPIKIKAVHPFAGTNAETTVTVGNDEKKTVDLILANPSRDKGDKRK
jgi:serine/threonine-protein kinase